MKWYGHEVKTQVGKRLQRNCYRAGEYLKAVIVKSMPKGGGKANTERTGKRRGTPRAKPGQGRKAPQRSKPGDPPYRQTSHLADNIYNLPIPGRPFARKVGTQVFYGIILETTKNPKLQRPFIRPAFHASRTALGKIISTGNP